MDFNEKSGPGDSVFHTRNIVGSKKDASAVWSSGSGDAITGAFKNTKQEVCYNIGEIHLEFRESTGEINSLKEDRLVKATSIFR